MKGYERRAKVKHNQISVSSVRDCATGKLITGARGFRVIASGAGARHPKLAVLIEDFTTKEGAIAILKNAIGKSKRG